MNPDDHKLAVARYENLARQKEVEAQGAAEKARKKANGARKRSVSLPALLPPHAPRSQTCGTIFTLRAPLYSYGYGYGDGYGYGYGTPFLVAVPLNLTAGLASCVAPDRCMINPSGSCGVRGLDVSAGSGGTGSGGGGGGSCGEPGIPFLFVY